MRKNLRDTTVSRDYVDNILRSMIDSVIVASEDGRIQTVNDAICNLLGYKAEELLGQSIQKVIAEPEEMDGTGEKPSKSREVERLIEEGSIKNSERAYVAKDGRKIPVSFSGALMTDGGEQIEGLVFVAQDITERKRSAEELARQTSRLETLSQLTRRDHLYPRLGGCPERRRGGGGRPPARVQLPDLLAQRGDRRVDHPDRLGNRLS